MRIVKAGLPQEPLYIGRCEGCDCIIECLESELERVDATGRDCWVRCPTPQCSRVIDMKKLTVQPSPGKAPKWADAIKR